ncbi:MAG: hypothetical protein NC337_07610 [Roseburia sp.]|nr:hypothetical protein [Roseburia sp.]
MKSKKLAAGLIGLCVGAAPVMMTACGSSEAPKAETVYYSDMAGAETGGSQQGVGAAETENPQPDSVQPADHDGQQEETELEGIVERIGENSVVVNKIYVLSTTTAVSYVGSEEDLVTVHFSEETRFEVWTVKNSGINGEADTDKREGTALDIKEQSSLNMTGRYEGEDFYAETVIIYDFV